MMGAENRPMNQKLNLTLAFAAGSAGALLTRYVLPTPVFAQTQPPVVQEIRARSFILVDGQDRVTGKFMYVPDQGLPSKAPPRGRIVLLNPAGQEIWSVGGNSFRPLNER
jgi:hypothetical protein